MLDRSALSNFNVLVVTPCFGGTLFLNYVLSIINLQRESADAGLRTAFYFNAGDSLITRSRNDCVAYFLANTQFTHLFWIDADIGFAPEQAFRLLLADRDIVAGVYPLKREDWPADGVPQGTTRQKFVELYQRYPVNSGRIGAVIELVIDSDGFMKVREAPTGFMCVKRRVLDQMVAAYPDLKYVHDWPEGSVPAHHVHYRFFDAAVDPDSGRYLSEDYAFCRLWEKLGGEIFIDATSQLSHKGSKLFYGDYGASLRSSVQLAVGGPKGQRIELVGLDNLNRKP